jgi:hypothetical protein
LRWVVLERRRAAVTVRRQWRSRAGAVGGDLVFSLFNAWRCGWRVGGASGGSGSCIDVNTQSCPGELVVGLCPGPNNIECCLTNFGAYAPARRASFGVPVRIMCWRSSMAADSGRRDRGASAQVLGERAERQLRSVVAVLGHGLPGLLSRPGQYPMLRFRVYRSRRDQSRFFL